MPKLRTLSWLSAVLIALAAVGDEAPLAGGHPQADNPSPERQADKPGTEKQKAKAAAKKQTQKKAETPSDAQREEAVFLLVREHHPDLLELLKRLKTTKKKEYQQAVKELYRDSQRLEVARERDPERYKLDLRAWQLDSRIRLLTAKLSLEDRPELQEDLKAALAERSDVRLAQKQLVRDRAAARLKQLDEEVASLTANRDEELKRTFERLLRVAEKARPVKREGDKGTRRQGAE